MWQSPGYTKSAASIRDVRLARLYHMPANDKGRGASESCAGQVDHERSLHPDAWRLPECDWSQASRYIC